MNVDEKTNQVEAEPIFDDEDIYSASIMDVEMADVEKSSELAVIDIAPTPIPIPLAPTTRHYSELMNEINYYNYRGSGLLKRMYKSTFATGLRLQTKLIVNGVWERGEIADYEVKVYNYTGFDLKDVYIRLTIKDSGDATIISPPGSHIKIGDIGYRANKKITFKAKAEKAGDVSLDLRVDGLIGDLKQHMYYDGRYWNGSAWAYKHPYRVKYPIY